MEKVFFISNGKLSGNFFSGKDFLNHFEMGEAIVEKVLGSKRYLVTLADGKKMTAVGSESIKKGAKVQVSLLSNSVSLKVEKEVDLKCSIRNGNRISAFIPVKFGNEEFAAKLELYVERDEKELFSKKDPIVYLVFSLKTEIYGQIQWSVYLKKNQVLVQVYAEKGVEVENSLGQMVREFEGSLKKKGFSLLAPTVILKKPFKVPTGFRLNIRG